MSQSLDLLFDLPRVRRAWPGPKQSLVLEQFDEAGRLRAGIIDATAKLRLADYARDAALPELSPPESGQLVVHRFGKRAVVIHPDKVRKFLRPNKVAGVVFATRAMHEVCAAADMRSAAIIDVTAGSITTEKLPGDTLHQLDQQGLPGWIRFGELWPELIQDQAHLHSINRHGPEAECRVLRQWFTHATSYQAIPQPERFAGMVNATCRDLLTEESPWVLSHRDLHDKQLLWDGDTLSLLDTDTTTLAEAALDLGNLLAHAELRRIQQVFHPRTYRGVRNVVCTLAERLHIPQQRLRCYTQSATIRLAFLYAFRPSSRPWFESWIAHCLEHNRKETL